jgi:hypothetical protein
MLIQFPDFFSPWILMNRRNLTQRQDGTKRSGRRQLAPHGPGEFTRFGNLHLFSRQPIRGRRFRSRHTRWEIIRKVNIQILIYRPLIKKCDTVSKETFRNNWNSIPIFSCRVWRSGEQQAAVQELTGVAVRHCSIWILLLVIGHAILYWKESFHPSQLLLRSYMSSPQLFHSIYRTTYFMYIQKGDKNSIVLVVYNKTENKLNEKKRRKRK